MESMHQMSISNNITPYSNNITSQATATNDRKKKGKEKKEGKEGDLPQREEGGEGKGEGAPRAWEAWRGVGGGDGVVGEELAVEGGRRKWWKKGEMEFARLLAGC